MDPLLRLTSLKYPDHRSLSLMSLRLQPHCVSGGKSTKQTFSGYVIKITFARAERFTQSEILKKIGKTGIH